MIHVLSAASIQRKRWVALIDGINGIDSNLETSNPRSGEKTMNDIAREQENRHCSMGETEQKVRYGIGSAAAAAAIFAPLGYKWKGVLTGVAAFTILSGVYGFSPVRRALHI
jgi:hypothetical protein